jgi:hypothetical protein
MTQPSRVEGQDESRPSRHDERIGQLPGRSFRLAVAAVVHAARDEPALSSAALGAYDAHVPGVLGSTPRQSPLRDPQPAARASTN